MTSSVPVYDVVVAGAGAAGLALAASVKQTLGPGISIALIDPAPATQPASAEPPVRAVAIAEGPRRLLERIGAWKAIDRKAQPILEMTVMDGGVRDAVRLPHLSFEPPGADPLASMAFSADVLASLSDLCEGLGVTRIMGSVDSWRALRHVGEIALIGGQTVRARLVVATDGGRSRLRALADIRTVGWDYDQCGIVATIAHELNHQGRAEQHFLPAGPFAILPLPGRQSSIVWNEKRADADALLQLDPEDLVRQLEYRFTPKLGAIRLASRVEVFPLGLRIARRFVGDRLALAGDAAHIVHPLAGQGLNLGLRDVAALAEAIVGEMRLGLDPGAPAPLAAYERARRFDIAANGMGMDAMNRLFSNDVAPLRFVRDVGLRTRRPRAESEKPPDLGGGRRRTRRAATPARASLVSDGWSPRTLAAQALGQIDEHTRALVRPINVSSTFIRDPDNLYRSGNSYGRPDNDTVRDAEAIVGALEGAAATLIFGSGMSAAVTLFLSLGAGAHIVAPRAMYYGVRVWLMEEGPGHGLKADFVDSEDLGALERAIRPGETRLVWLETPSNPLWGVSDISGAAKIAHAAGALIAVELDLRDADLHAAAFARRRRRDAFGDEISQRPFRPHSRRALLRPRRRAR